MRVRPCVGASWRSSGGSALGTPPSFHVSLLELFELALLRALVVAPADERRAVPDAPVADVVVAHLDDELRPQRDPLQVATVGPARRLAAAALAGLVGRELGDELAL